ncbi:hypothetical protein [Alienimonas californiensis]|uniref:Uncharacterized protein n=1 Tax=Alienimonas californiensis TaxID=2527989 RepID=A0A517PAU4_9PLAN|nr:hypothetical protein [Alienimonas californiensis]QDT16487.1 hypothetical protein CA12_25910 [Alienimonas californiensis]
MASTPAALLIMAAATFAPLAPAPVAPASVERGRVDGAAPDAPSLADVFPTSVPAAVDRYAFDPLGDDWTAWGEATSRAVTTLYRSDAPAARQRAAIAVLRSAVKQLGDAARDPGYAAMRPALLELRGALDRRSALAAATLDALAAAEKTPVDVAREGANARLGQALATLRADLAAIPGGERWLPVARADRLDAVAAGRDGADVRSVLTAVTNDLADPTVYPTEQAAFLARPAWRRLAAAAAVRLALAPGSDAAQTPRALDAVTVALRQFVQAFERYEADSTDEAARALAGAAGDLAAVAPSAGGAIEDLVDDLYDGDNFRVAISEGFLRRFVAQTRREVGPVSDVAFGARVRGVQETDVDVDVDVRPEVGAARFEVTLNGVARTSTVARTREARVSTSGRHRFEARKSVVYDGTRFRTGRTRVDVDPYLRNTSIQTSYDDLAGGLLRDVIQREAFAQAGQRQPAALARVERQLAAALRPQLDRQLDEQFDVVNLQVGGLFRQRAARLGVAPSRESISSTEEELRVFLRMTGDEELAAPAPPRRPFVEDGVVAQIHQSALNNSADRLNLAGRTLTPDELGGVIREFFGELFGRTIPAPPPAEPSVGEEPPPTLTFADADPIRVRFAANTVILTVRVGLAAPPRPDGSPGEDVPPQRVAIPFAVSVTEAGDLVLNRGSLSVAPLGRPESRFRQQAIARVLRARLGDALPESSVIPANTVVATDSQTRITLRLASLELADGWATAVLR